jgi:hypothetical protein
VTGEPEQIVVSEAEILTLTGKMGLMVTETFSLVARFVVWHVSLDVKTTETTSPLIRFEGVNVLLGLLAPEFNPFIRH